MDRRRGGLAATAARPDPSPFLPLSLLLAILASSAPGIYAWASGRRLLALIDDPIFPERHFARSRELFMVTIIASVIAPFLADGAIWLTLPVLLFGVLAGSYPSRRRIYDEQWSFATYLRFMFFSGIGMLGFWALLIFAPGVIAGVAEIDPRLGFGAAAAIAVLLIVWQLDHPRAWLAIHRATPIDRPDLGPLFDAILAKANCPRPTIHQVGAPGGHVMNAIALPHPKKPAVAFGTTALERLAPRELAAILAHEVAHLEYYDARRLRRMGLATLVLVALATVGSALIAARWSGMSLWLSLGVMLATLLLLAMIASKSQGNETASDLRAIELAGDPDALIDALTKLHVDLRLPRHWPHEVEKSISHPSLARRIQAIRECAHVAGPALGRTTIVRTPAGNERIALDETRAYWFEGLPAEAPEDLASMREMAASYRALAYSELSELRLVSAGKGKALKARDLSGKAWVVSLRPEDVPLVDRALSVVDVRLGQRRRARSNASTQLLACAMFVALLAAGQLGLVLVPLLIALVRPAPAALAALGAMALARVGVWVAGGDYAGASATTLVALVAMGVIGLLALRHARKGVRASQGPTDARPTLLALGGSAAIVLVIGLFDAEGMSRSMLFADPRTISLAVALLGFTAALATLPARHWRRTGLAAALISFVIALGASRASLNVLGHTLPVRDATGRLQTTIDLDETGMRLELSPGGSRFAVLRAAAVGPRQGEVDMELVWTVGTPAGATRDIDALDLAFIDDERVVALAWRDDSLEVTAQSAALPGRSEVVHWRRTLPAMNPPELLIDRGAGLWAVAGRTETGDLAVVVGSFSGEIVSQRTWPADSHWSEPLHFAADGSLLLQSMDLPGRGRLGLGLSMLPGAPLRFHLWRLSGTSRTPLGRIDGFPQCQASDAGAAVCAARHVERARVVHIAADGTMMPIGRLPSGYDIRNVDTGPLLTAVATDGRGLLIVDPETGTATRLELPVRSDGVQPVMMDAQSAGPVTMALELVMGKARVAVYRVE